MTTPKSYRVAGGVLRNGALIQDGPMKNLKVGTLPSPQRTPTVRLNDGDTNPRRGAAKLLSNPTVAGARIAGDTHFDPTDSGGMRNRTDGHPLGFVGGMRPLDDEPNAKSFMNGKTVPIHNGMNTKTPETRGADYGPDHGSSILNSAGPGSWREPAHGSQRLPAKK